jgi:hypothetical protein
MSAQQLERYRAHTADPYSQENIVARDHPLVEPPVSPVDVLTTAGAGALSGMPSRYIAAMLAPQLTENALTGGSTFPSVGAEHGGWPGFGAGFLASAMIPGAMGRLRLPMTELPPMARPGLESEFGFNSALAARERAAPTPLEDPSRAGLRIQPEAMPGAAGPSYRFHLENPAASPEEIQAAVPGAPGTTGLAGDAAPPHRLEDLTKLAAVGQKSGLAGWYRDFTDKVHQFVGDQDFLEATVQIASTTERSTPANNLRAAMGAMITIREMYRDGALIGKTRRAALQLYKQRFRSLGIAATDMQVERTFDNYFTHTRLVAGGEKAVNFAGDQVAAHDVTPKIGATNDTWASMGLGWSPMTPRDAARASHIRSLEDAGKKLSPSDQAWFYGTPNEQGKLAGGFLNAHRASQPPSRELAYGYGSGTWEAVASQLGLEDGAHAQAAAWAPIKAIGETDPKLWLDYSLGRKSMDDLLVIAKERLGKLGQPADVAAKNADLAKRFAPYKGVEMPQLDLDNNGRIVAQRGAAPDPWDVQFTGYGVKGEGAKGAQDFSAQTEPMWANAPQLRASTTPGPATPVTPDLSIGTPQLTLQEGLNRQRQILRPGVYDAKSRRLAALDAAGIPHRVYAGLRGQWGSSSEDNFVVKVFNATQAKKAAAIINNVAQEEGWPQHAIGLILPGSKRGNAAFVRVRPPEGRGFSKGEMNKIFTAAERENVASAMELEGGSVHFVDVMGEGDPFLEKVKRVMASAGVGGKNGIQAKENADWFTVGRIDTHLFEREELNALFDRSRGGVPPAGEGGPRVQGRPADQGQPPPARGELLSPEGGAKVRAGVRWMKRAVEASARRGKK